MSKQCIYITNSLCLNKLNDEFDLNYMDYIRLSTLDLISREIYENNVEGAVAELGVYKGKFARYINQFFYDKDLYLFDTFEGFDKKDILIENSNNYSKGDQDFTNTSINEVLDRMKHKEKCIVKKGYFPDTTNNLDMKYSFVSIDADLYEPIYNGLVYFYKNLSIGGYIMVHDFNNKIYTGAKDAVKKFCKEYNVSYTPISDAYGTAVISK